MTPTQFACELAQFKAHHPHLDEPTLVERFMDELDRPAHEEQIYGLENQLHDAEAERDEAQAAQFTAEEERDALEKTRVRMLEMLRIAHPLTTQPATLASARSRMARLESLIGEFLEELE